MQFIGKSELLDPVADDDDIATLSTFGPIVPFAPLPSRQMNYLP